MATNIWPINKDGGGCDFYSVNNLSIQSLGALLPSFTTYDPMMRFFQYASATSPSQKRMLLASS
jgi:hypothetical protein